MENSILRRTGLLGTAVLFGVLIGGLSAGFLRLVYLGIDLLWRGIPAVLLPGQSAWPIYTLGLGLLGGVLVGLCGRYLGDHPKLLYDALAEFRRTGRFDYAHVWEGLIAAFTSLAFGASLGPEAALVDIAGGVGTWASDRLSAQARQIGMIRQDGGWPRAWKWGLFALAIVGAAGGFRLVITGLFSEPLFVVGAYTFNTHDVLVAVLAGAAGAGGGLLFNALQGALPRLLAPLRSRPVLRSLSGGLLLGLLGMAFPLVLFSGQFELQHLFDGAMEQTAWALVVLGLAKFFITSWLLNTGWKGGQFMPLIFGGATLGLAASLLIPALPPLVGFIGGMAGSVVAVIRRPLLVIPMFLPLFPLSLAGVIVTAALAGYVLALLFAPGAGQGLFNREAESAALS